MKMHICKLRPSLNPMARLMGDKWICRLCGQYHDYDGKLLLAYEVALNGEGTLIEKLISKTNQKVKNNEHK